MEKGRHGTEPEAGTLRPRGTGLQEKKRRLGGEKLEEEVILRSNGGENRLTFAWREKTGGRSPIAIQWLGKSTDFCLKVCFAKPFQQV